MIDALTGEAVGEVTAAHLIVGSIANLGERQEFYLKKEYVKSDADGRFTFSRHLSFKNPLTDVRESYYFQDKAYQTKDNSFPVYYPKIGLLLWRNQEIGLIPIVGTLAECAQNNECEKQFYFSQNNCTIQAENQSKDCRAFRAATR